MVPEPQPALASTAPARSTRTLKIVLLTVGLVFLIAAPLGTTLLVTNTTDGGPNPAAIALFVIGLIPCVFVPVGTGLVVVLWSVDPRTPAGIAPFRWMLGVAATILLCAAVALVMAAVLGMFSIPGAILLALGSAVLTALSIGAGEHIRRLDAEAARQAQAARRGLSDGEWLLDGFDPASIRRRVRTIVITFATTLVVVLVATALPRYFGDDNDDWGKALLNLAVFPFFAAAVACAFTYFALSLRIGRLTGGDTRLNERLTRAVLQPNKSLSEPLSPTEMITATQFAALQVVFLPCQFAFLALVIAPVTIQQATGLLDPDNALRWASIVFVVLIPVLSVVAIFTTRAQVRNARRFRDAHPDTSRPTMPNNQTDLAPEGGL